jgi:hypothetical protein
MGVGAAVVRADWLALDSLWVAPTQLLFKIFLNKMQSSGMAIVRNLLM